MKFSLKKAHELVDNISAYIDSLKDSSNLGTFVYSIATKNIENSLLDAHENSSKILVSISKLLTLKYYVLNLISIQNTIKIDGVSISETLIRKTSATEIMNITKDIIKTPPYYMDDILDKVDYESKLMKKTNHYMALKEYTSSVYTKKEIDMFKKNISEIKHIIEMYEDKLLEMNSSLYIELNEDHINILRYYLIIS